MNLQLTQSTVYCCAGKGKGRIWAQCDECVLVLFAHLFFLLARCRNVKDDGDDGDRGRNVNWLEYGHKLDIKCARVHVCYVSNDWKWSKITQNAMLLAIRRLLMSPVAACVCKWSLIFHTLPFFRKLLIFYSLHTSYSFSIYQNFFFTLLQLDASPKKSFLFSLYNLFDFITL